MTPFEGPGIMFNIIPNIISLVFVIVLGIAKDFITMAVHILFIMPHLNYIPARGQFSIKGKEFGLLAEGDMGKLSFQGTRYLGFERSLK